MHKTRWECRHAPAEMMYLEFAPGKDDVLCYLDHSPASADRWSFDAILRGDHDGFIRNLFGDGALEELKSAIRARRG